MAAYTPLVQDEEGWLDVSGFADAGFWIDVTEVTPPGGTSTNYLQLILETAPTADDAYFTPVASPIWLGTTGSPIPVRNPSGAPFVVRSCRSQSTTGLARYLRWRIVPTGSGTWDVTLRIRVVAGRSSAFVPTDMGGCVLWLRADLGIVPGNGANVSGWNDQSGAGDSNRNLAQSTSTLQPLFTLADPNYNGQPSLNSGTGRYLTSGTWATSYAQPTTTYFCGALSSGGRVFDGSTVTNIRQCLNDLSGKYAMYAGTATIGSSQALARGVGCALYNGASSAFYFTSSQTSLLTGNPGTSNVNTLGIFATQDGLGTSNGTELAEMVIFTGAHTAAQRLRMFQYLGTRYGQAFS